MRCSTARAAQRRALHRNIVLLRFWLYVISAGALWAMVIRALYRAADKLAQRTMAWEQARGLEGDRHRHPLNRRDSKGEQVVASWAPSVPPLHLKIVAVPLPRQLPGPLRSLLLAALVPLPRRSA